MGYVCWRSQCGPRSIACIFKDRRKTQSQRIGRSPSNYQTRIRRIYSLPSQHRTIFQTLYSILSCLHTLKKLEKNKNNLKESQCVLNMSRSQLNISTHAFENKKKPLNHVKVKIELNCVILF